MAKTHPQVSTLCDMNSFLYSLFKRITFLHVISDIGSWYPKQGVQQTWRFLGGDNLKTTPFENENDLPNLHFFGVPCVSFRGCIPFGSRSFHFPPEKGGDFHVRLVSSESSRGEIDGHSQPEGKMSS